MGGKAQPSMQARGASPAGIDNSTVSDTRAFNPMQGSDASPTVVLGKQEIPECDQNCGRGYGNKEYRPHNNTL
jgi:hypothetical protein